jgi:hypothetical protein
MSEHYEIFEKWMEKVRPDIGRGADVNVPIKSLDTFAKMVVRAKIGDSQDALPDGVPLRVVNDLGEKRGSAFIKIEEELGDEDFSISADH